jgi:hypothetical protein
MCASREDEGTGLGRGGDERLDEAAADDGDGAARLRGEGGERIFPSVSLPDDTLGSPAAFARAPGFSVLEHDRYAASR